MSFPRFVSTSYFTYILMKFLLHFCGRTEAIFNTHRDVYLPGHVIKTFMVSEWIECVKACDIEKLCISYNYGVKGVCELNSYGVVAKSPNTGQLLLNRPGYIYQQLKVSRPASQIEN